MGEVKLEKRLESVQVPAHEKLDKIIFKYNAAAKSGLTNVQTDDTVNELLEIISYLTDRLVFSETMRFQGKEG